MLQILSILTTALLADLQRETGHGRDDDNGILPGVKDFSSVVNIF
jgi:hypothetical protein